ncbi:MAG: glycosyltransferase family 1 protein [Spartobacteria bacterium]|nr:glycosyltransferase family 1 protein [Spartobacteria bacterium]
MIHVAFETSSIHITQAGVNRYIQEILHEFDQMPERIVAHDVSYHPRFSRSNRVLRAYDTINREILWMQYRLPREVRRLPNINVLHTTNAIMPRRCHIPVVVSVHDLYALTYPEACKTWHHMAFAKHISNVARHADAVLFLSEYVRNEFLNMFPFYDEHRGVVVHCGVKSTFRVLEEGLLCVIKEKYMLNKKFILGVSSLAKNKNAATTIRAFATIADKVDHELVFAGDTRELKPELQKMADALGIGARVRFLGYVSDEDLPALYNLADCFCYASLCEGFGMPPLEAMRCGTPVVTSNTTSLPEVVGTAALQVDPLDYEQLGEALLTLATDERKRSELVRAGFERASYFSWERVASAILDVYNLVL